MPSIMGHFAAGAHSGGGHPAFHPGASQMKLGGGHMATPAPHATAAHAPAPKPAAPAHAAAPHPVAPKGPAPLQPSQFPSTPGTMNAGQIEQAWMQNAPNGPTKTPQVAANMANVAMAESSDTPSTVQAGQPPGTTGYGMFQITPTSGKSGGWNPSQPNNPGANNFGNLLNVGNNIRAASNVLSNQGYHAFTDPVGLNLPSGPLGH